MKLSKIIFLLIVLACISCRQGESEEERQTRYKFKKYIVAGKRLYMTHCANCHQEDGNGFVLVYPTLNKADYLLDSLSRAACIIKYGQTEKILVNGQLFNQKMPGVPELTNLEIAEIINYITNSWDNQVGFTNVKEVDNWINNCPE